MKQCDAAASLPIFVGELWRGRAGTKHSDTLMRLCWRRDLVPDTWHDAVVKLSDTR